MQKDNLFESLGKYRDFSNTRPKDLDENKKSEEENYFTEAFKILLQNNPNFTKILLLKLAEAEKNKDLQFKLNNLDIDSITTQEYIGSERPDLTIILTDGTKVQKVHIEIKLNSKQGKKQLKRYLKLGDYIIYITLYPEKISSKTWKEHKNRFFGHFRWYTIYTILQEYLNELIKTPIYQNKKFLIEDEFLKFMEEKKMKPIDISGIKAFDEKIINTYNNLLELKYEILKQLEELKLRELSTINVDNTEFDTDNNFLYFVVLLKKFPDKNAPDFFYRIKFNNKAVSVRLTANDEFADEIIEKAKKCNFKTNDDEIYIEESFDELFKSKKPQQEVILEFVVESIKKINSSGVLDCLK